MSKPDIPREPERLSCDVCLREIPVTEARSEEAVDYVLHFCGLDCYEQWRAQPAEKQQSPSALLPAGLRPIELNIAWHRLVDPERGMCTRCESTGEALQRAIETLQAVLRPLGIRPALQTQDIDLATFRQRPTDSNRVWIDGTPLEAWLGAHVGRSPCCSVCAGAECRTLELGGQVIEAVPDTLIVKAALMAAARLLMPSERPTAPTAVA